MNRKDYKEFYKNEMDGFDSFACVLFIALIIAINIQAINAFLAKYNGFLDENRLLIFGTGVPLIVITIFIRRFVDWRKVKQELKGGHHEK
ncbi:hypothetical protein [Variovorax sp. RA8]|uniref:hypothetical protein n=1 Tax=Variovorax sp. (strain JCM 16519 / RA8) TaxID=662548 RepID=UPI000A739FA0|nr:hypothetical protein [Variovorax sp. RA8]VTU34567.1 hypothetical protein RA8CHR_04999 [Variovorax sp. RA8]